MIYSKQVVFLGLDKYLELAFPCLNQQGPSGDANSRGQGGSNVRMILMNSAEGNG